MYSTAEAGRVLNVTPDRVRQLARAGRIPHVQTPLGRLMVADAVDALALSRLQQPRHASRRGVTR